MWYTANSIESGQCKYCYQNDKIMFLFKSVIEHCKVVLIKRDTECESIAFFKFLKTCLSCLVVFYSWHEVNAEHVFPNQNRKLKQMHLCRVCQKSIFTKLCHSLYLLLPYTDDDEEEIRQSIFVWRQLGFGKNVASLIWDLNLIYSIVLLQYLLGQEALTVSCR